MLVERQDAAGITEDLQEAWTELAWLNAIFDLVDATQLEERAAGMELADDSDDPPRRSLVARHYVGR